LWFILEKPTAEKKQVATFSQENKKLAQLEGKNFSLFDWYSRPLYYCANLHRFNSIIKEDSNKGMSCTNVIQEILQNYIYQRVFP